MRENFMHGLVGEVKLIRRRSFTLIELLMVISIIGILSSMLLPSLQKARTEAYRSVSSSQMKQIGLAFISYADSNDECLPPSRYPTGSTSAWPIYVRETLDLPITTRLMVHPGQGFASTVEYTYGITDAMRGIDSDGKLTDRLPRRIQQIQKPSRTHTLTESKLRDGKNYSKWRISWSMYKKEFDKVSPEDAEYIHYAYSGAHNLLNADISVRLKKFTSRATVTQQNWQGMGY
ncbi:MAG: type II secretion system GspH family protein [Lentisphaerales bacterium]|nr:type II secretion system GspH family protein [Lentisphaerales bacterium]